MIIFVFSELRLYDMRSYTEVGTLLQHDGRYVLPIWLLFISCFALPGSITCLCFYKDTHLFSASEDRTICIWKCGSWDRVHTLTGHRFVCVCVCVCVCWGDVGLGAVYTHKFVYVEGWGKGDHCGDVLVYLGLQ